MSIGKFGGYWHYPLHVPALFALFAARNEALWWYGLFYGEWGLGVIVRRPAKVNG